MSNNNPITIKGVPVKLVTALAGSILEKAAENNIIIDEDVLNNVKLLPRSDNFYVCHWNPISDDAPESAAYMQVNGGRVSTLYEFISYVIQFRDELGNTVISSSETITRGPLEYNVVSFVVGFTRVIKLEAIGISAYQYVVVFDKGYES